MYERTALAGRLTTILSDLEAAGDAVVPLHVVPDRAFGGTHAPRVGGSPGPPRLGGLGFGPPGWVSPFSSCLIILLGEG